MRSTTCISVVAALSLAACGAAPVPRDPAPDSATVVADTARLLADELSFIDGQRVGDGFVQHDVRANGQILEVDFRAPVAGETIPREDFNRTFGADVRDDLARGLCRNGIFAGFLAIGGTMEVTFVGSDDVAFSNNTITRCP